MSTKLRAVLAAGGILAVGLVLTLSADDRPAKPAAAVPGAEPENPAPGDHDGWMHLKLLSSQQAFDGLTHGEFHKVETAARCMLVLNLLEDWAKEREIKQRSQYRAQLNAFEFAVKELVRTAEDHNTEGALDAYVSMTRSCVRCHELIRDRDDKPQAR